MWAWRCWLLAREACSLAPAGYRQTGTEIEKSGGFCIGLLPGHYRSAWQDALTAAQRVRVRICRAKKNRDGESVAVFQCVMLVVERNPAPNLCNSARYNRFELLRKGAKSSPQRALSYQLRPAVGINPALQSWGSSIPFAESDPRPQLRQRILAIPISPFLCELCFNSRLRFFINWYFPSLYPRTGNHRSPRHRRRRTIPRAPD